MGSSGTSISHLQFTDDTIFFYLRRLDYLVHVMRILRCFYAMSTLKVNFHRSHLFGINVDDEILQSATDLCCTNLGGFP